MPMSKLLPALALLPACTALYADDLDKKQCTADADCRGADGAAFTCRLPEGICEALDGGAAGPLACTQNRDCPEGQLCGFDQLCYEKWGCLNDDPDWPAADDRFTYAASLVSIKNPENPDLLGDDVEVLACSSGDPDCASPIARGQVDGDKRLTLPFADFRGAQFNGFIRIRDAAGTPGTDEVKFLPAYVHYGSESRLVTDLPVQSRIFLVDPLTYRDLAALSGAAADPDAGTVIFIMQDCGGRTAEGVSMKPLDATGYQFVAVQGGNQPVPGATATTADGAGLLVNIPPDKARTFVLSDETTGREIARVSINVRGRATNYVFYYPRFSALSRWLDEYAREVE